MENAEASEVDVDAVLQQLKQAKERELRLRAEKERVRKEIEALRTGDLWSRETTKQRDLEAVQARRRALQAQEAVESERLRALDDELREKEVNIQRQRRSPLDAIKQAATSIVAPVSAAQPSPFSSSASSEQLEPLKPATLPSTAIVQPTIATKTRYKEGSVQIRRPSNNQDSANDAIARLTLAFDLEKQQMRIKRLEQQVEQSKALQQSGDNVWDLPVSRTRSGSALVMRRDRGVKAESPIESDEQSRTNDVNNLVVSNKKALPTTPKQTSQVLPTQVPTQKTPQVVQTSHETNGTGLPHSVGVLPYQPHPVPGQVIADPHYVYRQPPQPIGVSVAPIPLGLPGYASPAYVASSYPIFSPPVMVPMMNPALYAPWTFQPPLGHPTYGYSHPVMAQPPSFAHAATSIAPQSSPPVVAPPIDQDLSTLQAELDVLRKKEQESEDDKEFAKVQELLAGLQRQVTQLTRTRSGDMSTADLTDTPRSSALAETKDPGLASIKRQHLEAVLKVRNERDLLEEQDKLEEVQERVEKRREERKRDSNREALISKQKQELMALRLQRAMAKMDAKKLGGDLLVPSPVTSIRSYDPDDGVLLCWDFASGLLASAEKAQLTFAVYDGKVPRSPIKAILSRECESEGPSHKRAIFAANRLVKPLPASDDTVVIVEVSSFTASNNDSGKPTQRRLGWAAFELFKRNQSKSLPELQLASRWLKIDLSPTPMPDPTTVHVRGSMSTDMSRTVILYCRIAGGEYEEQARNALVDPDVHAGRYQLPEPSQQRNGSPVQLAKEQAPPAPSIPLTQSPSNRSIQHVAATAEVVDATSPTNQAEQRPSVERPPPSRDFLDIERLRLLSSSSATNPPPSGIARPRSTLSSLPRHRVGVAAGYSLSAVPESQFHDTSSSSPWIRVDKSLERHRRLARQLFQPGDAFDVYIDGARFLPDNVTITKVTIAALNGDRTKISPFGTETNSQIAVATSDVCNPNYNLCVEYREKVFDPTLTLMVRVDTLDSRSRQPVILAYAVFAVFVDADSHSQPTRSNGTQFGLNEGAFQLPLYVNSSVNDPASGQLSATSAVASAPRLPCATLLIRVKRAIMSEDGLQVLSRKLVPPVEWTTLGLDEPAPPYDSSEYDSTATIPTPLEMKLYHVRDQQRKKHSTTVQQTLALMGINVSPLDSLFPSKPSSFVDLNYVYRYQPAIGLRVAIDGLHNVKVKTGGFCRVLYSVAPPGTFYQPIRLTNDVHFTTTTDWSSLPTSPEFQDGFIQIRDTPADPRLVIIVDVRVVARNPKTNAYQSQPLAWSFVPVLNDATGSVAAGNYQIPLFLGEVKLAILSSPPSLSALVEEIVAEKKKQLIPFMDGASVFVRLDDPQVPSTTPSQPITGAVVSSMTPAKSIARYQYDTAKVAIAKKKTPLSKLLPPGVSEKQMDAEINQAFAAEMGIPHY